MSYKGKYKVKNREKYVGAVDNVQYRSSWERRFMVYCDVTQSKIVRWSSEELILPYRSPVDGKIHRYFPDFFIKYRDALGKMRNVVIEVKPAKQLKMPKKNPKKRTKSWAYEVQTYVVNQAKFKAAEAYCADRKYEFRIMTEKELGIS